MTGKPKKGRVARLSDFAIGVISAQQTGSLRETIDDILVHYMQLVAEFDSSRAQFALPSDLFRSLKEARGEAVLRGVRARGAIEEPVKVRVIK